MPKGSNTSAAFLRTMLVKVSCIRSIHEVLFLNKNVYLQLYAVKRVRILLSRRYSVSPATRPSWSRFFEEFHCRECGFQEAYRSRPRSFFEKRVLPLLLLQTVRCERCYHRGYVLRTIPTLERFQPQRKQSQSEAASASKSDTRVA
jgi:hypothetical protein